MHPDVAKRYEQMKYNLSKQFEHDREGYTEAKTEFIQAIVEKAKSYFSQ
jgi:GrpB-like predicted nucleotidyltransferase (UPF0157 family)